MGNKYSHVMSVYGDAKANPYVRDGWEVIGTHFLDRVTDYNARGQPSNRMTIVVYVLGLPYEEGKGKEFSAKEPVVIEPSRAEKPKVIKKTTEKPKEIPNKDVL